MSTINETTEKPQILSALATGGAVVCGQYLGRKDNKGAKKCATQLYSIEWRRSGI